MEFSKDTPFFGDMDIIRRDQFGNSLEEEDLLGLNLSNSTIDNIVGDLDLDLDYENPEYYQGFNDSFRY